MPAEIVASQPPSREPAGSDRLPVHRSESPTGYSSAGCSPAEPASASPVSDIVAQSRSGEAIKCAAQPHCAVQALAPRLVMAPEPGRVRRRQECHLYFARRVSFLSCADTAALGDDAHGERRRGVIFEGRADKDIGIDNDPHPMRGSTSF